MKDVLEHCLNAWQYQQARDSFLNSKYSWDERMYFNDMAERIKKHGLLIIKELESKGYDHGKLYTLELWARSFRMKDKPNTENLKEYVSARFPEGLLS